MDISTTLPEEVAEEWQLSLITPLEVSLYFSRRRIIPTLHLPSNHPNTDNKSIQNKIVTNHLKEIVEVHLSEQLKEYTAGSEKISRKDEGKTFFDSLVEYVKRRLSDYTKVCCWPIIGE